MWHPTKNKWECLKIRDPETLLNRHIKSFEVPYFETFPAVYNVFLYLLGGSYPWNTPKKCGLFLGVAMVWWKFHTGQFPVHLPFPCEASIILSRVLGTSFDIRGREPECKPPSTSPTLELVPKSMLLGNLSDTCWCDNWNPCIVGCSPPKRFI